MKFLAFNIVVLGALFYLYQFGDASSAPSPEPAQEQAPQAESSTQESAVVHALADRVAVLTRHVARLENHVSEVMQREDSAGTAAVQAQQQEQSQPEAAPRQTAQTASKTASATVAASATVGKSAGASPRKPRPEGPKRPAAAPIAGTGSHAAAPDTAPAKAAAAAATGESEFSSGAKVADRSAGPEWSDGAATGSPVRSDSAEASRSWAAADSDEPVIEGELMSPSQRRHALLELAQDMELHYLASAGE